MQGGEDGCHVGVNERHTKALGAPGCGPSTLSHKHGSRTCVRHYMPVYFDVKVAKAPAV